MTDNFSQNSVLDVGKNIFVNLVATSLARVLSIETSSSGDNNPFIDAHTTNDAIINQRSKLEVMLLKEPSNRQYQILNKIWFDGIEMKNLIQDDKILAESNKLVSGIHNWVIKSFLVKKDVYKNISVTIKFYQNKISDLKQIYEIENDPEKKQELLNKIQTYTQTINGLFTQLDDQLVQVGDALIKRIEVL